MKLKESIVAAGRKPGGTCTIATIMAALSKPDADDFAACLADPQFTASQISRGLAAEGHKVGVHTVQRHRNQECACEHR